MGLVVLWLFFPLLFLIPGLILSLIAYRRRVPGINECISCEYDLSGIKENPRRCPECGLVEDAKNRPRPGPRLLLLIPGILLIVLALLQCTVVPIIFFMAARGAGGQ